MWGYGGVPRGAGGGGGLLDCLSVNVQSAMQAGVLLKSWPVLQLPFVKTLWLYCMSFFAG